MVIGHLRRGVVWSALGWGAWTPIFFLIVGKFYFILDIGLTIILHSIRVERADTGDTEIPEESDTEKPEENKEFLNINKNLILNSGKSLYDI